MFGLENRGETLIFMLRRFDKTMTSLISHFFPFWCTKTLIGDYFVLRINYIVYSKQKIGCFIHFSIFPALLLQQCFPIHFVQGGVQVAYG